jgi:hypothetical protein
LLVSGGIACGRGSFSVMSCPKGHVLTQLMADQAPRLGDVRAISMALRGYFGDVR